MQLTGAYNALTSNNMVSTSGKHMLSGVKALGRTGFVLRGPASLREKCSSREEIFCHKVSRERTDNQINNLNIFE